VSKSADTRSVATDALATLGMIHEREEKRDAIHLAVIPAVAGESLWPGTDVVMRGGVARCCTRAEGVGIVDPFLPAQQVDKGQRFWLIIYPRKITSLRHVWSHPAFPDELPVETPKAEQADARQAAEAWMRVLAENMGLSYGALLGHAESWLETEDYVVQKDAETWRDEFDAEGFWPRYELVTGKVVPERYRVAFFSCSC